MPSNKPILRAVEDLVKVLGWVMKPWQKDPAKRMRKVAAHFIIFSLAGDIGSYKIRAIILLSKMPQESRLRRRYLLFALIHPRPRLAVWFCVGIIFDT